MVDSAIPVARATCAMPPYPIACASVAAQTRRDRSVRTGDKAACFARRVARSTSAPYHSSIRSTRSYFLTGPYLKLQALPVISDRLWRTRFSAHPQTLGRLMYLDGNPFTIIGILPPAFTGTVFANQTDVWAPLTTAGQLAEIPRLNMITTWSRAPAWAST
jgi:hypothetical protein